MRVDRHKKKVLNSSFLSCEKDAQLFIEGRSDSPYKLTDFKYQGTKNIYKIYEINIK